MECDSHYLKSGFSLVNGPAIVAGSEENISKLLKEFGKGGEPQAG